MSVTVDLRRTWKVDELDQLPEDAFRYELVDGHLVVTPPAEQDHQWLSNALRDLLQASAPDGWRVIVEFPIAFSRDTQRQPDVAAFRWPPTVETGRRRSPIGPADVGLLVEVVSPSSRRTDRFAKPGEYADAGIEVFWRLETDPELVLLPFVLRDGTYVATEPITGVGEAPTPWGPVTVDVSTLGF